MESPQKIKHENKKLIVLTFVFSFIYLLTISYLDFEILTSIILPEDYRYDHLHEVPWWVELSFITPASNGDPDGSFFHLFALLLLSIFLGFITVRFLTNKLIHTI